MVNGINNANMNLVYPLYYMLLTRCEYAYGSIDQPWHFIDGLLQRDDISERLE